MEGILNSLGVHWTSLAAQLVNFGILAFVLYRFALKPALSSLDARVKKQEEADKNSEAIEAKLREADESVKATLAEARKEGKRLLDEAENSAALSRKKLLSDAEAMASKVVADAKAKMEAERGTIIGEIKKDLLSIVSMSLETTIAKSLSHAEKEKLSKEATEEALRLYEKK